MANISDFLANFTTDLARPSRFNAVINLPQKISYFFGTPEKLNLRCEQADLPGRSLMTHDQKIYGPIEKFPYQNAYNDISMTFMVDDDMYQRYVFDNWMNFISSTNDHNFKYKVDYCSDISIIQYNNQNEPSYGIRLIDAFPIDVNQMDLDWASPDNYHKLTVVFAYTYWEYINISLLTGRSPYADLTSSINSSTRFNRFEE